MEVSDHERSGVQLKAAVGGMGRSIWVDSYGLTGADSDIGLDGNGKKRND